MQKRKVSWKEFQGLVAKICRDISLDTWRPDYVVGITRGGLLPAVMISQYFGIPCETLKVCLRDGNGDHATESNLWMAEDAFGHAVYDPMCSGSGKQNILIVDDINDSGATINWILRDWPLGCFPNDERWIDEVWNQNVKFATVFDNLASKADVKMDFVGEEIDKSENPVWIEFPFEEWWTK
jgi:hypoxanthine phosphoribosyltransferase